MVFPSYTSICDRTSHLGYNSSASTGVHQQFENSVLQTAVMSRTVKVNPLVVLLSVLLGVELFGFIGAIFAIPLAGSLQVFAKEVVSESRRDHLFCPDRVSDNDGGPLSVTDLAWDRIHFTQAPPNYRQAIHYTLRWPQLDKRRLLWTL